MTILLFLSQNSLPRESHVKWNTKTPGGSPLYKSYRYVLPERVGVVHRFGLKTEIDFAHFGQESGMVFEGTAGIYERIYRFNSK